MGEAAGSAAGIGSSLVPLRRNDGRLESRGRAPHRVFAWKSGGVRKCIRHTCQKELSWHSVLEGGGGGARERGGKDIPPSTSATMNRHNTRFKTNPSARLYLAHHTIPAKVAHQDSHTHRHPPNLSLSPFHPPSFLPPSPSAETHRRCCRQRRRPNHLKSCKNIVVATAAKSGCSGASLAASAAAEARALARQSPRQEV